MSNLNLIVVSHPDDEILGCGGTCTLLAEKGEVVQPIILCGQVEARNRKPTNQKLYIDMKNANKSLEFKKPILGDFPNIKMNNVDHLEIVKYIEEYIKELNPKRIFTHHSSDLNDDHKQVSESCQVASRFFQRNNLSTNLKMICLMETLSSTEWSYSSTYPNFAPNYFVDITSVIDKKLIALSKYTNVMREAPHPRSEHVLKGHAAYRGAQCGSMYAEAFELIYLKGT